MSGRLALVTGAARGLGLAIVKELAERQARVVATDLDAPELERALASLGDLGERCRAYPLDVTDASSITTAHQRIGDADGRVEILINNAGVVYGGAFLEVPLERHLAVYRVNVLGLVAMTHAFLGDLIAADGGRLVNIASASAFVALPWAATYSSSKWSVVGFSEGIRLELAELGHRGIRVTTVCPSYIETGLFDGVKPPRLTRTLSSAEVAARVVSATERGDRRLLLPSLARTAPFLVALPAWFSDFLSRKLGVASSMKHWRGR